MNSLPLNKQYPRAKYETSTIQTYIAAKTSEKEG